MVRILRSLPLAALLGGISCSSSPAPPSVVIVVLDTLRQDCTGLGPAGADRSRTPHLDALAADGAVFPRAWSTAPWTVPAHASLLTGHLPAGHGCTSARPRLDESLPTLAEKLGAAGYQSAAFFSNPWLSDEATGLLRGFDERHAAETPGPRVDAGQDQGGLQTLRNVLEWLGRRDRERPFLLFVNLLEAHAPYDPPASSRAVVAPGLAAEDRVDTEWILDFQAGLVAPDAVDWARVRSLYGADAHFADALLAELVGLLREHVDLDDAVVVVTSDHGENLGEHGFVNHQFRVDENLLAVPLVVRAPGRVAPGRRDEPALITDVFATVLELAGLEAEPPPECRSLVSTRADGEPRPIVAEYAGGPPGLIAHLQRRNPDLDPGPLRATARSVRWGDLRLTVGAEGVELHDLAADPGQANDVSADRPDVVRALDELMTSTLEAARRDRDDSAPAPDLSPETLRSLKSLGYVH
jgi:arylsulfatase A-like enzyme